MSSLESSRHSFRRPPVYETALAVQFETLPSFRSIHFGLFYETIADRFPVAEDHPRSEPIMEAFPIVPRPMGIRLVGGKSDPRGFFS